MWLETSRSQATFFLLFAPFGLAFLPKVEYNTHIRLKIPAAIKGLSGAAEPPGKAPGFILEETW